MAEPGFLNNAEQMVKRLDDLSKSLEGVLQANDRLNNSSLSRSMGTNSESISNLIAVVKDSAEVLGQFGSLIESGASKFGMIGAAAGKFVSSLTGFSEDLVKFGTSSVEAGRVIADAFDAPSRPIRDMERNLFDLDRRFGASTERSREFQRAFDFEVGSKFADSLHLASNEMIDIIESTSRTSINLGQLNENVKVGTESVKLYAAATAYSAATGIGAYQAVSLLNDLLNKQGMTAQQAVDSLGMYSAISKTTGLAVEDVATSLNRSVSGFDKLGMTADFGRPALESFSRVVKDMGLGIEQSTDLADTLTRALGGLATNYTNAYLLFQRGGLNLSSMSAGGGVLGASIGMQAAMLRAERGGPEAQADMARQLTAGLRDTIASFGGGRIVTVEEAAETPGLQTQFYTQQQMLKQFGISDEGSANRVLDLLARLDEATASGNQDAQDALSQQIQAETDSRNQTMDASEKLERKIDAHISVTRAGYREQLMQGHQISEYLATMAAGYVESATGDLQARRTQLMQQVQKSAAESLEGGQFSYQQVMAGYQKYTESRENETGAMPPPVGATGAVINKAGDGMQIGNVHVTFGLTEEGKRVFQVVNVHDRKGAQSANNIVSNSGN